LNARGFGFVITDEAGPDVFVPAYRIGGALHGDRVRVTVSEGPKGLEGEVIEVIERGLRHLGGQLHVGPKGAWIEPNDERVPGQVRVEGALPPGARTGQGVLAKIVGYPDGAGQPLRAQVLETFEPQDFARFELRHILLREGVAEAFPDDVRQEATRLPRAVTRDDAHAREDLRALDLVTIDPVDARDHDDAVWAERRPSGGWRVVVAIADVSHYVREGSALDREALARGCTIYLPSHAIPMLPGELSSHLASLVPDQDRLALAVEVDVTSDGVVERHRFVEAVMRSKARISYEGAARALGLSDAGAPQAAAEERRDLLRTLLDVADALRERRRERGSLWFDLPEAKVKLDPTSGAPVSIERSRANVGVARAYNLVEELMLLANEVVARELTRRRVPTIYRVHGPPDADRVEAFAAVARTAGFALSDQHALHPKELSLFLARIEGTPHAAPIGYLLLRAMQQATYSTENVGHFGLAADDYVHFTSPIRRYPDLAVHRIVRRVARGEHVAGEALTASLAQQAAQSSLTERRAMTIEREVVDLYGALLMRERIGETFDGATITGVAEHGVYASLHSPFVTVLCPVAALPYDRYELGKDGVRLVGAYSGRAYALGDKLRVRIDDVSLARRKVIAVPITEGMAGRDAVHPEGGAGRAPGATGRRASAGRERARGERRRGSGQPRSARSSPGGKPRHR
jgi:ribonuclease R